MNKERKFKSYLIVEFPDNPKYNEDYIDKVKKSLEELIFKDSGAIVKKVDYITNAGR